MRWKEIGDNSMQCCALCCPLLPSVVAVVVYVCVLVIVDAVAVGACRLLLIDCCVCLFLVPYCWSLQLQLLLSSSVVGVSLVRLLCQGQHDVQQFPNQQSLFPSCFWILFAEAQENLCRGSLVGGGQMADVQP